jgi:hypothetical protein
MITILIPLCASTVTFDSKSDYFLLVFTVVALDGLCFLAHKEINRDDKAKEESKEVKEDEF